MAGVLDLRRHGGATGRWVVSWPMDETAVATETDVEASEELLEEELLVEEISIDGMCGVY